MRTLPFSCIFPKHGNNGRSQTGWNLMSENGYLSEADPLWYKDAVIYEVPVRAFFDSDGDGVGDLRGLTEKLDYIQDLGVTAIWLPPFYPSPLKDDGYDIVDYRGVHPAYGTLQDFRRLIHEAHDRGLRIITELVIKPHLRSASLVPARPPSRPGLTLAGLLRLVRSAGSVSRSASHFSRLRDIQLGLGSGCAGVLLAPVLLPSAGSELSFGTRKAGRSASHGFLAGYGRRWDAAGRDPLPVRARGD